MKRANDEIREYAKKSGVYLWEVAAKYGITDTHFSRRLRFEFSPEEQKKAFSNLLQATPCYRQPAHIATPESLDLRLFFGYSG